MEKGREERGRVPKELAGPVCRGQHKTLVSKGVCSTGRCSLTNRGGVGVGGLH